MRKTTIAAMTVLAGLFAAQGALAQEIVFVGEKCPLTVLTEYPAQVTETEEETETETEAAEAEAAEAEETESEETGIVNIEAETINLLGMVGNDYAAVVCEDGLRGFVARTELEEKVIAFDLDELPAVDSWEDLTVGSNGDTVMQAQEMLIELSFLNGKADGKFGNQTAGAVKAFQEAAESEEEEESDAESESEAGPKTEASGVIDCFTWLLLLEEVQNPEPVETPYPPVFTAQDKFASIYDSVADQAALDQYVDPQWRFSYDVFEGTGEIAGKDSLLASWQDETGRAIDRLAIDLSETVYVSRNESGTVDVLPSLKVTTTGAYRPGVKAILVRAGSQVAELPCLFATGRVEGADVKETAIVPLTEEAEELLAGDQQVTVRIKGGTRDFDLTIN